MQYFWKIRVWDKEDEVSSYSDPAFWGMGLMDSIDYDDRNRPAWSAKWIAFPELQTPIFRKKFTLKKQVKRARAYICGLGYYELYLNGVKVGDYVLDPAQTDYDQRAFYVTYDIQDYLNSTNNAVGIILGNGWYNQDIAWKEANFSYGNPGVICQLVVDYTDGSHEIIETDGTWKVAKSPILNNNIYVGEEYDALLEIDGWSKPGIDDTAWENAKWNVNCTPLTISQQIPPIKKIKTITPVDITNPFEGGYIFDMGQNFAGWARLKVKAPAGTIIKLRFAEILNNNGTLDCSTTGDWATDVVQTDTYICKGDGLEIWEPRFTYHGFQYVEMTGLPYEPTLDNIEGIVVNTAVHQTGKFKCSDSMFNKIHEAAIWTQLSNLHGIPTDCPHRERCGWLGDAHLIADMTIYNFDMALFWKKFIDDIETTRRGKTPFEIAPGKRLCGANPDWQVAFIILPWEMYLYYGDIKVLREHYDGMNFLMENLQEKSKGGIISEGYGDWCAPGNIGPKKTPVSLTTTAYYYYAATIMCNITSALKIEKDEKKYLRLSKKIKSAFIEKFYDDDCKTFGSQCSNALALYFGLVPLDHEQQVADNLAKDIMETHNCHITTGILGSRFLYSVLSCYGHGDVAIQLLNQTTEPSVGHMFSLGATTIWEKVATPGRLDCFGNFSLSHPMQAAFTAWFYQEVGGIEPDPRMPGFKHFILKPQLTNELNSAEVEFDSIHGKIKSIWRNEKDKFHWCFTVPANTTATVYVPAEKPEMIHEQNVPVCEIETMTFIRQEKGYAVFETQSGQYELVVRKRNCN